MAVLSVVIPAYNEVSTIGGVVEGHRDSAARLAGSFEIIVCDDGSTDGTADVLAQIAGDHPELTILTNSANLGIPATMRRLYEAARGEWIYFAPGDGQVPASALETMWQARAGAALVVGRRHPRRDPRSRVLVAELYSAGLRMLFRLPVHDIDSVKLYDAAALRSVPPRSWSNFMEAEILIGLHRARFPIREVRIEHRPRIAGRAKGVTLASALHAIADVGLFTLRDRSQRRTRQ